ncbi:hypothetical protein [Chitinophaga defluvii]|uniref:Uncharacterized protein n=1 Tax=Chitinophaga defluvii TaxID=3163343 RepID=A0ABV2TCH4_9BACT
MEADKESFTIQIDLIENGNIVDVLVIPSEVEDDNSHVYSSFATVLDGVTLAILKHENDSNWSQIEGSLDQQTIDKIGREIDSHFL